MNRLHRWYCSSNAYRSTLDRTLPWAFEDQDLGHDVLEVGPGPGITTALIQQLAARVTVVEVDSVAVKTLRDRFNESGVRIVHADATSLPFPDNTFSGVVALTMLHHVPTAALQDRVLTEISRVLRPDGLFAGCDRTWSIGLQLMHVGDTFAPVNPDSFARRLQTCGFSKVTIDRVRGRFRFGARKVSPSQNSLA